MNTEIQNKIEALYLQMYELLYVYASSSLEHAALAEEVVQDTFVIACNKAEECLNSPSPQGWLVNTLKNIIRNTLRNQDAARRILSNYCALQIHQLVGIDDHPELELLYGKLANTEEFILLKEMAVDGRSYKEMASSRGISIVTCRKRVQRAREYLQKELEDDVTK